MVYLIGQRVRWVEEAFPGVSGIWRFRTGTIHKIGESMVCVAPDHAPGVAVWFGFDDIRPVEDQSGTPRPEVDLNEPSTWEMILRETGSLGMVL